MKDKLVGFVNRREQRFSGGEPHAAAFHSRSYHRFFEGYSEIERIQPNGRVKIERVYTGVYYILAMEKRARVLLCLGYTLAWLLAAALFTVGAVQQVGSNIAWYVTIFQMAAVAMLFWMLIALFNYLTAPEKRTIHDQRVSSGSLKHASLAAAAALAFAALATLIYLPFHPQEDTGRELLCAALFLLAGGISYGIHRIERRIPYREEQSGDAPHENGSVIE